MAAARPPSFLVFMTDQQRADHLGCYGNRTIRTPHIDGIAQRGTLFDRCYVASPVCMPNRAALATGRMPGVAGVRMNGVPLPLSARTHVEALRERGWRTALVGKAHLQNMTDVPATWMHAVDTTTGGVQATTDARTGAEYQQESAARWRDPGHAVSTPYYGFDHVELCLEHGDEVGGDYARWLAARGVDAAARTGPARPGATEGMVAPQTWRTGLAEDDYPSAFVRDRTVAWLEAHARRGGDSPFYVQCSFPDPHHPFAPPGRWFDAYRPEDIELPASFAAGAASAHPVVAALHAERVEGRRNAARSSRAIAVNEAEARQAIAVNYGSIALVDHMIGDVLAALQRLDLARDTVVVFLSDHGDFMGDHGLLFKGPLHLRSLIRMPFLWADPQSAARGRRESLASAIDLAPTVLARAGVPAHHGLQGIDLAPALDAAAATRDAVLIEESGHRALPGMRSMPRVRTLVTARWRLSVHAGEDWGELYDLCDDPGECRNLWLDSGAAQVRAELLWQLADALARHADECPLPARMA